MSLGAKNINSQQPVVLNDDNDMEVFDFSTLRDELAVGHPDEEADEQDYDDTIEFDETGDSLGFEFATSVDNFTSSTFEEEAFGVRKATPWTNQGNLKQSQPNLWNKDPFAGPSYETQSLETGNKPNGTQIKKITRKTNTNAAPISHREISAGISFASILSGSAPQKHDDNETQKKNHGPAAVVNTVIPATKNTSPEAHPSPPSIPHEPNPQSASTLILQELKAAEGQRQHPPVADTAQPGVYNVTEIEASMGQQQQRPSNKNLLYQLLPELSSQQQQQTPLTESPQHQASKQGKVDINSFFQKHHERQQQQQQQQQHSAATSQQPPVDVNAFFQKHKQQQARAATQANIHQHVPTGSIHKPNMTTEQELKQKEDDGKDSYDGLMTAKNVKYIDKMERSKLADSNQHTTGDFYYHMYTANHGTQPHPQPTPNQLPHVNNSMIYQQEPFGDTGKDQRATLDKVLGRIIKEHESHKSDDKKRSKNDHQQLLKTIESIYFLVLQVEQSYREMNGAMPAIHHSAPSTSTTRQETMSKIWDILAIDQSPRTVISILKVNKGMSLIGRLVPHLDESQRQILITTIAYYFADILPPSSTHTVDTQGPHHQQQRQNIDIIHPSISGCLEHILYCASLSYITQILSSVSNCSDFKLLVGTTTGHRFLGTLLFHAKGKQQQGQEQATDCDQWKTAYGFYFEKAMDSSSVIKDMAHLDNLAVWMLLNSMAVCCDPQQKETMAQAYRETVSMIMKTISDLERNHVPVPYPIQASYPVVKELWSNLSLTEESIDPSARSS